MSKHTLKSVVQRGSMFGAVLAIVVATFAPASSVFADALNPLTERSLMLSSSAPGFTDTDGSGNSVALPNAAGLNFAPAGSGPNGKKTGETFSFKVSSDSSSRPIEGLTFQYCTGAAGLCQGPGTNSGDASTEDNAHVARTPDRGADTASTSDLNVKYGTHGTGAAPGTNFEIYVDGVRQDTGWLMKTSNVEDLDHTGALTGADNFITLYDNAGGAGLVPTVGKQIKVVFKASDTDYITNPGAGSFFVKINTYDSKLDADHFPAVAPTSNIHLIDGGVTVANVMTDSIHITTKVLETMSFSVGTKNRDASTINCGADFGQPTQPADCEAASGADHGKCYPVQSPNNNRLDLGNPNTEYSLETGKGYDVNSFWRLSSNSSGGATVYYSGNTLANTVGDEIKDMQTETQSTPGTEQFGLGFVDVSLDAVGTDFTGPHPDSYPFRTVAGAAPQDATMDPKWDIANLPVQPYSQAYDEATGTLDNGTTGPGTAKFKFLKASLQTPEPIAQQNDRVISCATAKMRYVANIGADTPAGVYTTKINYLAAPQY